VENRLSAQCHKPRRRSQYSLLIPYKLLDSDKDDFRMSIYIRRLAFLSLISELCSVFVRMLAVLHIIQSTGLHSRHLHAHVVSYPVPALSHSACSSSMIYNPSSSSESFCMMSPLAQSVMSSTLLESFCVLAMHYL
jgi:hypothetical protein